MSNGEFAGGGGVTQVTSLPTPSSGLKGIIFYLTQSDGGFDSGYYVVSEDGLEFSKLGGGGTGQIYITDATPISGNISNKLTADSGTVLTNFRTDVDTFNVHVRALAGESGYKPEATIAGVPVTNFAIEGGGPEWNGSATITVPPTPIFPDTGTLTAEHEDGSKYDVVYEFKKAPDVQTVAFSGSYPGSQTEIKTGQTFDVDVTTDVPMSGIRVEVYGIRTSSTQLIPVSGGATLSETFTVTVQNSHSSVSGQDYGVRVTAYDADNSFGDSGNSDSGGSVDGVNVIKVNNLVPSGSIVVDSYSNGFSALASGDTVNLTISASNYDTDSITSPTGELNVDATVIGSTSAQYASGTYNISTDNIRLELNRAANDTQTIINEVVNIADAIPDINISSPSRLRSGGNQGTSAQNHTITIAATQQLYSAPTLVADVGTFQGGGFSGGPTNWTRNLQITDNDTKGTGTFSTLVAVNLAGKTQNVINSGASYTVGGFVFRTLTVSTPFSRTTAIGTEVVDTSKLRCTNLSKGSSGSLNFTFKALTPGQAPAGGNDEVDRFTIIDSATGFYDPNGDTWYNLDSANANSNSTGGLQLELEELI